MLGTGEPLSAFVAFAHVSAGRETGAVVIGGRECDSLNGQYVQFTHQLALFLMEAKRISVAWRKPRQPVGQQVKVIG